MIKRKSIKKRRLLALITVFLIIVISIFIILKATKAETLELGRFTINQPNTFNASSEAIIGSWDISTNSLGSNMNAILYEDGRLVISGNGRMKSWNNTDDTDWHQKIYAEKIEKVVIESGVTTIGRYAFINCVNLTEIEIADSITRIGAPEIEIINAEGNKEEQVDANNLVYTVFENCKKLTNINVDTNNENYTSINGILFNKEQTEIEYYPEGIELETYSIPNTVIKIRKKAFRNAEIGRILKWKKSK